MGVMKPDLVMRNIIPVIMAGVLGLGGAVGGSNVGEDQRRRDAHEPQEWGGRRAVLGGQEGGQHGSKINGTPSLHSTLSVP